MQRIPEAELMDDPRQALAYAQADFAEPHQQFVELFAARFPGLGVSGLVLDLGCGPGDITRRFARAHPQCRLHGVDGSRNILQLGRAETNRVGLAERIELRQGYLPGAELQDAGYDVVISNSLLHHLADPGVLWQAARRYGAPGAAVFVMDLVRPADAAQVMALVDKYAGNEPEIFRRDFSNSLHAAYEPAEVQAQLTEAGLERFVVSVVGDRHLTVHGRLP